MRHCYLLPFFIWAVGLGATAETGHPLRGVVTSVVAERQLVMVKHEEIPGFMRAMPMAFSVPEEVYPRLTPGTHLIATMYGSRGKWRLENVQLTDETYQPLPAADAGQAYLLKTTALPAPASPGASAANLIRGADGAIYLSWLETDSAATTTLRYARFDPATLRWSDARPIAQGLPANVDAASHPQIAVSADGRLTAVWLVAHPANDGHTQAWFTESTEGRDWSPPALLTHESTATASVTLQPLARGGVLAVWLDGRAGTTAQLYGRLVGTDGPDRLIDDSVCERSPPALTAFPDGSVLLAYRARGEGGVRDIHTARFQSDRWSAPRILSADDWRPAHGPVNGPRLASVGGNVAAVWFTAADNTARLLTAASPDAGARFTLPQPVDLGQALGPADLVLLRDGSRLVTWLEGGEVPGLYLRRLSPTDEPDLAVRLAPTAAGFSRIALVKDYDATPAKLLLTYTRAGESSALHTTLLTLPDLSTLAGRKPCLPCDEEDANAVRGYPMKGLVTDVQPDRGLVIVKHDEIPGVMRAMTMAFKVDAALLPQLTRDQALLGRIEKRGRDWWLFNVKLLGAPPAAQN